MRIFLAGGTQGSIKPLWKLVQGRSGEHLSGEEVRHDALAESMKLFPAEVMPYREEGPYTKVLEQSRPFVLESFFYADEVTEKCLPYFGDFLLDSGAFTFMVGSNRKQVVWEDYVERYADFINHNHVQKFFELDIDSLVGYEQVKALRSRLEKLTNRQSIPVWHKSRGKDEFLRMADAYPYVALGGIVSKEWSKEEYNFFPWFISQAHKRKARIHALGFTQLEGLKKYHFDSVDSAAWTTGHRFGYIYQFTGSTMVKHDAPDGHRLAEPYAVALINFTEWVKFQKYAEVHL